MEVKEEQSSGVPRPGRSQAERSQATREALVGAGRKLFAERGFAAVGTGEIVRAAGGSRGALYHHFDGKQGLLEAVYEQIEREPAERIAAAGLGATDPLGAMRSGTAVFLHARPGREVPRERLL